jgi:hypothetical protein
VSKNKAHECEGEHMVYVWLVTNTSLGRQCGIVWYRGVITRLVQPLTTCYMILGNCLKPVSLTFPVCEVDTVVNNKWA